MRRLGRFGERVSRRLHRAALLLAVLLAVVGGLLIAGIVWWLLWWFLGARAETPNQVDLTKIALTVTAGVGGAVALVVSYRKQRDQERARFAELFGAAAKQLGDPDVAVRIAGVYAMAGVADEFGAPGRRQQCIDVLCGYLRLPYEPDAGANHLISRSETVENNGVEVERRYQFRQNDREVRRAIVDVIVAHVRPSAEITWSDRDFDFADAVLEDADFRYAEFSGERTYFARSVFTGARATTFEFAKFTGRYISFHGAVFRGVRTLFDEVTFAPTESARTELRGAGLKFDGAIFSSPVSFHRTIFRGSAARFRGAKFRGERTSFAEAGFLADHVEFGAATFEGAQVVFDSAIFGGSQIDISGPVPCRVHLLRAGLLRPSGWTNAPLRQPWRQGPLRQRRIPRRCLVRPGAARRARGELPGR
ncbi:pentapeptide repeat-containing protein [Nocardia sp. NBC_00508]|uniref:pentapeptide repeat-containing protein n=1 Tax=Nocardia sp. NBC_00508 TaxID=2975992 RepID=UPI002E7FC18C|nr:pentapeptide repeat-containing protein [Nocardia sp. NBC_00508]WUD67654.1 pentapeptide repeat-containing protein [Nocardia sp. NBC_00508]